MKHVSGQLEKRILDSASVFFYRESTNQDIELLLAKRKPHLRAFPNLWSGIGGKVSKVDKEFVGESDGVSINVLKSCALREVLEETGLYLLANNLKQGEPAEEVKLQDLSYSKNDYDWNGLIPAGLKVTPEFTITHPIFKTQYFLYKLSTEVKLEINPNHKEFDSFAWKKPEEWVEEFENQQIRIPPPVLSLVRTFIPHKTPLEAAKLSEAKNLKPVGLQTEIEVHPGVYGIPMKSHTILPATTTNCAIIGDANHRYIVDPGSYLEDENKRLLQVIDELVSKESLKGILLTHHHKDHWEGIPYLQKELNVPIFAHEKTKQILNDQNVDLQVEKTLTNNVILDLGADVKNREWKLEVLFTGGHSRDHIVFLDKRFNALLAGDLVAGVGTVLVENMSEYLDSLDMLLTKNIGVILPGHGGMHYDGHKLLSKYKSHRLERLNLILEAFIKYSNQATIEELTEQAYSDVDKQYHEFAKMQVQTYMKYLEEKGEVEKENNKFRLLK